MATETFGKKSTVQALDPACGVWLIATVVDLSEDGYCVRWRNYKSSDWIKKRCVRKPIVKRVCQISNSDWKRCRPSLLQKGQIVTLKKPDGTIGDNITIEENDPFSCCVSSKVTFIFV